jgi:integrase
MRSRTRKTKGQRSKRRRAPIAVNGTVPPRRVMNVKRLPREYLTIKEVELLTDTARKRGRCGHRDATMILIAFRHGLRPSEVCALRWDMVDLGGGLLHVRRSKNRTPSVQPAVSKEVLSARPLHGSCRPVFESAGIGKPSEHAGDDLQNEFSCFF